MRELSVARFLLEYRYDLPRPNRAGLRAAGGRTFSRIVAHPQRFLSRVAAKSIKCA